MTLQRHRHHFLSTLTFFTFLLFFSAPATALSHLGRGGRGNGLMDFQPVLTQKRLGGPGSSPPSCRSSAESALHYYPEAWRCKCGNELLCLEEKAGKYTRQYDGKK
ncbi:allergen-related family protein [Salix suchowensis]|nr:allergen-related family protein [Salix suchowensis]